MKANTAKEKTNAIINGKVDDCLKSILINIEKAIEKGLFKTNVSFDSHKDIEYRLKNKLKALGYKSSTKIKGQGSYYTDWTISWDE